MTVHLRAASAALLALLAAAPTPASAAGRAAAIPFSTGTPAYPESFSWSATLGRFLVGSVRHGTVGTVGRDGTYAPFITDDRLVSTVGILADDASGTLWVANADPGVGDRTGSATKGTLAGVGAYDLKTGKPKAYYDLGALRPGAHFANDVALDRAGNAYVTDSFAPLVYRIDTAGHPSVFAEDARFRTGEGFNLNGIAVAGDSLLVGQYNTGELFRIGLKAPRQVEPVSLPEPLKGADGFHLVDARHLVVVQNLGVDRTVELASTDGWRSARIVRTQKSAASMPTAATAAGGKLYVLDSRLDTLFDPKASKVATYSIEAF